MKLLCSIFLMIALMFSVKIFANIQQISFDFLLENSSASLFLPVPNKLMSTNIVFELWQNNKKLNASYSIFNKWPALKGKEYIRLLIIDADNLNRFSGQLTLTWHESSNGNVRKYIIINKENPLNISLVYPSKNWLAQSLLLHPKQNSSDNNWYVEPQKKYANYVTNVARLTKKGYPPHKPSQWLYDRPQAIYQLYIMTGDKQWLNKANTLTDFYQNNIDDDGKFKLKKNFDVKYLMPKGLLYRYLLSGDERAKNTLTKIYQRSLDWDEDYSLRRGFWTERNQAAALNVAISYWELTSSTEALERINNIIDATVEMTFNPQGDWQLRGCPQHSFKSHEGWGDDSPACSPWMMALLGDALWRFYRLTGDIRSASLIDAFGDFIFNQGIFYGNKRVKNIIIPKYLVSMENAKQEELDQWSNPQHVCDVAGLVGKSVYIKNKSGNDSFLIQSLFSAFVEQCQQSYVRLKKEKKKKQNKPYWSLKPPRRFAWMYSTTSDLPWLNNLINAQY